MPKKTVSQKRSEKRIVDNPFIVSLLLTCAGLALFLMIDVMISGLAAPSDSQAKAKSIRYTVQDNFQQQASNDGNLTMKTAISPASLRGPIISPDDPSRGPDKAVVNIVYFSDFTCRFCRQQEAVFQQAVDNYPDQVRVIRKDLPENDINSQSYQAAKASRCALQQNRFWPFHDQLMNAQAMQSKDLEAAASKSGLDVAAFRQCLKTDGTADQMIANNWQEADALGISGTPYTYVNQRDFLGDLSWNDLRAAIEAELASSSQK